MEGDISRVRIGIGQATNRRYYESTDFHFACFFFQFFLTPMRTIDATVWPLQLLMCSRAGRGFHARLVERGSGIHLKHFFHCPAPSKLATYTLVWEKDSGFCRSRISPHTDAFICGLIDRYIHSLINKPFE